MPVGVIVTTAPARGAGGIDLNEAAQFFLPILSERGPITPTLVRSMGDLRALYGDRVTYGFGHDQLETYFAEGGTRAWVRRVVGASATTGTLNLNDRAGTPLQTLRVEASSPGAWSGDVAVEVADGFVADTFNLYVTYKGDRVETYTNLTSPADAVTKVNPSSVYIRLVNLGSATAAPNNNPAVAAQTSISTGTDDRASVVANTYITALADFGPELGAGVVAIPGFDHLTVGAGLKAHAAAHNRLALLAPAAGTSVAAAASAARTLRAGTQNEYVGFFYPHVTIPDGTGGTRTISPEGYVAGVRARTVTQYGTSRAPAGEIAASTFVVGVERILTKAETNTLSDDAVSPIRQMLGSVRLYGWRSLSADENNYRFLNGRDVLNDISVRAERILEQFLYETIDSRGHLFVQIATALAGMMQPFADAGGLYSLNDDGGYRIDTSMNTPTNLAAGEIKVALSLRISPVGELIRLLISKVSLSSAL